MLSTVICTFGLVTDSAAVIIGGMLVAPLMSPILGISAASLVGRNKMFGMAALAVAEGALLAVALSAVMGWLARQLPFELLTTVPQEILARTRPSPLDLGVALAGGAAAAYALAQPHLSAALPGVAIATALLPPLCTVGIGLAMQERGISSGALLLFLTNFFAIAFAGIATFGLVRLDPGGLRRSLGALAIPALLVAAVLVPLVALTTSFVRQVQADQALELAIADEVARLSDAQLVEVQSTDLAGTLGLEVTVRSTERPTHESVVLFQDGVARRLQRRVSLVLTHIPITRLDPLDPPGPDDPRPVASPSPSPSASPPPPPAPAPTTLPLTARGN